MKSAETLTELQSVIENLANGINAFTGECANEDDIVNDVKIARCLFATSEVLKELVAKQSTKRKRVRKAAFYYDAERMQKVLIEPRPISLTVLLHNISVAYDYECRLTYNEISPVLLEEGVLEFRDYGRGARRVASPTAKQYGIWSEISYRNGPHMLTFYDENGQKYVLELLKKHFASATPQQEKI